MLVSWTFVAFQTLTTGVEQTTDRQQFEINFWSCLLTMDVRKHDRGCCHFALSSLCQWRHEPGRPHMWQKGSSTSRARTDSSLVKNTPTWGRTDKLKFGGGKKKKEEEDFCVNIGRTTKRSVQMEPFARFLRLQASSHLRIGPFVCLLACLVKLSLFNTDSVA